MAKNTIPIRPPGATGAYATEDLKSRVGMTSGVFGVQNATRLMHVHLARPGDDPIQTIRNLSSANGRMGEGDTFPWPEGNQVLGFFTIEDCRTSTYYILRAHYVPTFVTAFAADGGQRWDVELTTALETEHVLTDATGKGVGTPKYNRVINPTTEHFDFYAASERELDAGLFIPANKSPLDPILPRHLEGMDHDKAVGSLTCTKKISTWNHGAIAAATRMTNYINSDDFHIRRSIFGDLFMARPGLMKFQGIRIGKAQIGGNLQAGQNVEHQVGCQITLLFKFDADGFQTIRTHKHKFDDGAEAPIRWASAAKLAAALSTDLVPGWPMFGKQVDEGTTVGDIVREKFIRYPGFAPFGALLDTFK